MFRWRFILRKLFTSSVYGSPVGRTRFGLRRARPRRAAKPSVEVLEDRVVPSATTVSEPSPVTTTAALFQTMQQEVQQLVAVENALDNLTMTISQDLAQEWANLLGNPFALHNPASNSTPQPNAKSSGSNTATTVPKVSNQQPNLALQQSGSGSDSGAVPTAIPKHSSIHAFLEGPPPPSGGGGGGGTGGTATVKGQVWLDNNSDGSEDDGELGFSGVTVELETSADTFLASTTTDANGNYSFTVQGQTSNPQYYQIQVFFPQLDFATFEDSASDINSGGYSPVFALTTGALQNVPAGIRSMNVTTTQDDPNAPIRNQVTLRDAIQTGDNWGVGTIPGVTFGPKVTGTINLQAQLPAIQGVFDIDGPGASTLTIQGNGSAANPYRIFTEESKSTISGLTIQGGFVQNSNGGGILNFGQLTLSYDDITNNYAKGSGGGVCNSIGAGLILQVDTITENTATAGGGGLLNDGGSVQICCGSEFQYNKTFMFGGAIYNRQNGNVTAEDDTLIAGNTATISGGGLDSGSGSFKMLTGSIANNNSSSGGGVCVSGGTMTLTVAIENNQGNRGGGIYVGGGKLTLNQVTVGGEYNTPNKARRGGGIFVNNGEAIMSGGEISNNTATTTGSGGRGQGSCGGGGLFVNVGSITLNNVFISGNTSKFNGGGIDIGGTGSVKISGGTIGFNNASGKSGGGAYNFLGTLTLNSITINGNVYNVQVDDNSAQNQGGGL